MVFVPIKFFYPKRERERERERERREEKRERERKEYFLISELGLCSHYLKVRTNKTWTRYHAEPICQLGVVHSDVFGVAIAA